MDLRNWITDFLGLQSVTQYGVQQPIFQSADVVPLDCSTLIAPRPKGFEAVSLAIVRDNLAVVPLDWTRDSILKPWFSMNSHSSLETCMTQLRESSFVSFHDDFLDFIGSGAKLERIHDFSGSDAQHVHEAPVYNPATNELVFADTSVVGWLWALEVDTHQIRTVLTEPPLENVNGATMRDSRIYLTTNGGTAPGIWNCSTPTGLQRHQSASNTNAEVIQCVPVVNNYRLLHLNSPNDLVFTSTGNILFTDPTYGWAQSWPGVGPPELPTTTYHFNTKTRALTALDNDQVLEPNGLGLSPDEKTLYVAESNSTSGKPIGVWDASVRNVYAFDFDEAKLSMDNRRLVHVVEAGWPDGLRVTSMKARKGGLSRRELVLVATMGGVDVVDVSQGKGAGVFLGKCNVGDDIIFNLEPVPQSKGSRSSSTGVITDTWLFTGRKGIYKLTLSA